jgi:predicted NUDIX family NTP pyrophosphohydrolase
MVQHSAGILMYRRPAGVLEVLLAHPGGPFWAKKDDGAWSIPKGLFEGGEDGFAAARREFEEETGLRPEGAFVALGSFRQPSGKVIHAWALEGDFEPAGLVSNVFEIEWPPRSGRRQRFPEVDRAAWFRPAEAMIKIQKGQRPILDTLLGVLTRAGAV